MTEFNSYPVFVADQVLMADHLNEIVNYLDEQDRLTRNKLIGIGIVCGLELNISETHIRITKGCGVTSAGYLIVQDEVSLSYYRPYELPPDFYPKYKSLYEPWKMWELLTAEESLTRDGVTRLESEPGFLRDKIVVLLLEMKEKGLKNCVDTNCDDKGEKIEFAVKKLLVPRTDLDKFMKRREEPDVRREPLPTVEPRLQDIQLRRFNVPADQLTSSDIVLGKFLEIVSESQLKKISEVLNYCYFTYKPILTEESSNPFQSAFETFKEKLSLVRNSNPFFIQYYYDWIDDIVKAYYEFKARVFDVQISCCPDEDLFPLHLMLGEATRDTSVEFRSKYRHYFLYSPLFNKQKDLLAEVQLLFKRLRLIIQNFQFTPISLIANTLVKITPSRFQDYTLSQRSIPYYYDVLNLFSSWSWNKTRKGNSRYNLSYHANQYSSEDAIVNPLLYDIERFNFLRIEGHIGKNFNQALTAIITQRNQFSLPFEVVALSTATLSRVAADDKECHFKDLESLYQVILAELKCKFGDLACEIGKLPHQVQPSTGGPIEVGGIIRDIAVNPAIVELSARLRPGMFDFIPGLANSLVNIASGYKKGDFIRNHCSIEKGSVAETYLRLIYQGSSIPRTDATEALNKRSVYAHFFYFLDCVENVMAVSVPFSLKDFNAADFRNRFKALGEHVQLLVSISDEILKVARALGVEEILRRLSTMVHTCFDERLEELKNEFKKRFEEIQALTNILSYAKAHPGLEHKAGVPKGGTFVLVYHETLRKPDRIPDRIREAALPVTDRPLRSEAMVSPVSHLVDEASVRDPGLLKNFKTALSAYLDLSKELSPEIRRDISDLLLTIPSALAPVKFRIPEFTVIADFYLPYVCCSDCPPITYVLPKAPEGVLSIAINPTEFCNNDSNAYRITVSPEGGALSSSAGGIDTTNSTFKPAGVNPGNVKLTYTLPDGRSTSVDVMVTAASPVDFRFDVQSDGITVKFIPGSAITSATWDFGDGTRSDETQPLHTFQFDGEEKEFMVKLSVKNGPCFSTAEHAVKVAKQRQNEFSISPTQYCLKDDRVYSFNAFPVPKNVKNIKNENKLVIARDATTGTVSFSPIKQQITETQVFNLSYLDIPVSIEIVVPNADFTMTIVDVVNPTHGMIMLGIRLEAKNQADKYEWTLVQGDRELRFGKRAEDISYRELQLSRELDLKITLRVGFDIPGSECGDEKTFTITREHLARFTNKGPFDNNTQ